MTEKQLCGCLYSRDLPEEDRAVDKNALPEKAVAAAETLHTHACNSKGYKKPGLRCRTILQNMLRCERLRADMNLPIHVIRLPLLW